MSISAMALLAGAKGAIGKIKQIRDRNKARQNQVQSSKAAYYQEQQRIIAEQQAKAEKAKTIKQVAIVSVVILLIILFTLYMIKKRG
jgi:hypothetical protein